MSDDSKIEVAATEAVAKAEAAATRRRWINLGEFVAVAGLLIGGASLWLSWQDRRDAATDREVAKLEAKAEHDAARHRVILVTTGADGGDVDFKAQAGCALQATDISFPAVLGVGTKHTVTVHRIDRAWVAAPLLKATDGGPDRRDGKLPVLIGAQCIDENGARDETAIYDLLWSTEPGGWFGGRKLRLRGLVFREEVNGNGQARLDALWRKPNP